MLRVLLVLVAIGTSGLWSHPFLSCWVHFCCCPSYRVGCTSVVVLLIMLGVLVVSRTPSYHVGCTSGVAGHTSGYVECTVCHTLSRTYFSCETFNRLHAFICAISSIRVHVCQWPPCWLFVNYIRPIRSDNTFRSKAPGLSLWLNVDSTRSSDWYEF